MLNSALLHASLAAVVLTAEPIEANLPHGPLEARLAVVSANGDVSIYTGDGRPTSLLTCPGHADDTPTLPSEPDDLAAPAANALSDALTDDAQEDTAPLTSPIRSIPISSSKLSTKTPPAPAQLAWLASSLFIACRSGPSYRWHAEDGLRAWRPHAASTAVDDDTAHELAPSVAIAGTEELWLADARAQLWRSPDGRAFTLEGKAPEAIRALTMWHGRLVVAGETSTWAGEGNGDAWAPLLHVAANSLSVHDHQLVIAGGAGILILDDERLSMRSLAAVYSIASWRGELWFADGSGPPRRLDETARAEDSELAIGATPSALATPIRIGRAGWARWLPQISAELNWHVYHEYERAGLAHRMLHPNALDRRRERRIQLRLTWTFSDYETSWRLP